LKSLKEVIAVDDKINELQMQIKKLEQKISELRLGRRILMDLLIEREQIKNNEIYKLKQEIKGLRRRLKK